MKKCDRYHGCAQVPYEVGGSVDGIHHPDVVGIMLPAAAFLSEKNAADKEIWQMLFQIILHRLICHCYVVGGISLLLYLRP